jgi:TetR/AcrR family transcriptional regulator, regulator of mycofactocin system
MVDLAMTASVHARPGRPPATDHDAIERAAFALFAERGFEATTIDDIAAAAGVGRRTLFRYYASKNDIPWGQFDASLVRLREHLDSMAPTIPVHRAVHDAVLAFNRLDPAAIPQHRQRMRLLLTTPALQAHSVHRYAQWRGTIAAYVASRYGLAETDLLPRTVGQVTLAISLSAYEQWLSVQDQPLERYLDEALGGVIAYFGARYSTVDRRRTLDT